MRGFFGGGGRVGSLFLFPFVSVYFCLFVAGFFVEITKTNFSHKISLIS